MFDDTNKIKSTIYINIVDVIKEYKKKNSLKTEWKQPITGFADARGTCFQSLRKIISPTHYIPQDFLSDCTVVLSYFLPFENDIGYRNESGYDPDPVWITAYIETNQLFSALNDFLIDLCKKWGYSAVTPAPAGMIDKEHIYSNWSQRHVAYAAGLGTFGLNNMLITDQGTCGRFYSLITNLPVQSDQPLQEERCLYKKAGVCGLCVKQCPIHAFNSDNEFDRKRCEAHLAELEECFGGDACGKCVVGLPCTYQIPELSYWNRYSVRLSTWINKSFRRKGECVL